MNQYEYLNFKHRWVTPQFNLFQRRIFLKNQNWSLSLCRERVDI